MKRAAMLWVISMLFISVTILPTAPVLNAPAEAQSRDGPHHLLGQIPIPPATLRSVDDMLADAATQSVPSIPGGVIPFRPGIDPDAYVAAKAEAAAAPKLPRPAAPAAPGGPALVIGANCIGETQAAAGDGAPPDADGAVGVSQYVQVTNSHVTVWDKFFLSFFCLGPFLDVSLNAFMGYFGAFLFDPRVVHDDTFNRWVITAEGFPEASGAQFQFIAVSLSEDATGSYFIFAFDTRPFTCPTCFWDYPQLGMDTNALNLTANVFNPFFSFSVITFLNKQFLYYGIGLTGCLFGSTLQSWAATKVQDLNPVTSIVEAPPGLPPQSALFLEGWVATDQICPILVSFSTVPVAAYGIPPLAVQPFVPPGAANQLDTLDNRFQNRSLQIDGFLYQTHTTNDFGLPTPRLYKINVGASTLDAANSFDYFASGFSNDFNPSVTVNPFLTAAVTWSSTEAVSFNLPPGVLVGTHADFGVFNAAFTFISSASLTGNFDPSKGFQRWGDYSSIAIDPTSLGLAWGVNEISFGGTWGTNIFNASIP